MEKQSKNKIGLAVLLIAIVLFASAVTYAFFATNVTETQEKLTVTTGTLALTFADNNTGVSARLNFGDSVTKTFTIKNTGDRSAEAQISWKNLVNTYNEKSLTYTLEQSTSETGTYNTVETMSTNVPRSETPISSGLSKGLVIPAGATYYYTLTIRLEYLSDVDQTDDFDAMFNSEFDINLYTPTALDKIMLSAKSGTPNFGTTATTDKGVYTMADDYGTSYYYRGAVTNNYVKFGGFYWRIIRINGDGSLRMIYDGTTSHKNGNGASTFTETSVDGSKDWQDRFINNGATQAYNANYDDAKYVGWMFGGADGAASGSKSDAQTNTTNADLKDTVDTWYKTNIYDRDLDKYVADAIFCNDRSTPPNGTTWRTDQAAYENLGFGVNATPYGGFSRFVTTSNSWNKTNPSPQFTCKQQNDRFTADDTSKGNGSLTYKVGLVTADEAVAAGTVPGTTNRYYYLYKTNSVSYWSLSPNGMSTNGYAAVFIAGTSGQLSSNSVGTGSTMGAVVPVISIASNYANSMTGSGTATDPYVIPGVE